MAELGNVFNLSTQSEKVNVDVEMLDYAFVKDCSDVNILNSIINVLKSGKEGYYPDVSEVPSLALHLLTFNLGFLVSNSAGTLH